MVSGPMSCCKWQWLRMSEYPLQLGAQNSDSGGIVCTGLQHVQHEASFLRNIVTPVMSQLNWSPWRTATSLTYLVLAYYLRSPLLNCGPSLE